MNPKDRLIVALDVDSKERAERLVAELGPHVGMFKVGMELFTAEGPDVVRSIVANVPGTGVFFQGGDVTVTTVTMIAGPFYLSQNPVATPAFRITPGGTLVSAGGNLGGGGPSEGRFIFQGDATVTGPVNFLDLELQGGTVDIDPSANVHGRLVLDGGRFAPGRVPAYSNITLEYHGDYAIADEWTEDGSAGSRPERVEISEGTLTWNASASSRTTTAVTIAPSGAFVLAGDASAPLRLGKFRRAYPD